MLPVTIDSVLAIDLPVMPCGADKHPRVKGWPAIASADPVQIAAWFKAPGFTTVGVPTGEWSGISVLDIDTKPDRDGRPWVQRNRRHLPNTRIHKTRSGGYHLLYRHKPGLRNSVDSIAAGVDVRANGGFIVWWPASGFEIVRDVPIADWPEWLDPGDPPERHYDVPTFQSETAAQRYVEATMRNGEEEVLAAMAGARNDTLNRVTYNLLQLAVAGIVDADDVCGLMEQAALAIGLTDREVQATLRSARIASGVEA